jgi:Domain of unknown function (DUF4157)
MRRTQHETDEAALRPKAARLDPPVEAHTGEAAAHGRVDVLGSSGLLDLQRAVGNAGVTSLMDEERSPVHDVISSSGRPLDPDVRSDMEARLGHDFGDVRVHDDAAAHDSARAVNARAYTVGPNVVFQRDAYDPSSDDGRVTLAHELTHVVQQRSGPVDGTPAAGGIRLSDPSDRYEREAATIAERAMATPVAAPAAAPSAAVQREVHEVPAVQREAAPDEEEQEETPVQGLFLQRQEAPGEEEEEEVPSE